MNGPGERSFEDGYRLALEYLQGNWAHVRATVNRDLEHLQKETEAAEVFLTKHTEQARVLAPLKKDERTLFSQKAETRRNRGWTEVERFCRETYGDDATDFALKTLQRQDGGH